MADDGDNGHYASPPCMAHEVAPAYFDPLAVDPQQARDVAHWRKAQRARLLAARRALSVEDHRAFGKAMVRQARALVDAWSAGAADMVVSVYWPIRGEPDLRPLMHALHATGLRVVLPVVETRAAPLVFRRWTPQTRMIRGDWDIPVPPEDAERLSPGIVIAPLVGWDDAGYRLGYGGGYFDRTLAKLDPRPRTIGVGYLSARLATIYPQPHDIPFDAIVTEAGQEIIRRTP